MLLFFSPGLRPRAVTRTTFIFIFTLKVKNFDHSKIEDVRGVLFIRERIYFLLSPMVGSGRPLKVVSG